MKSLFIKQANIKQAENILDYGCGTATLTIKVKENQPEAYVYGVDVDDNVLKIAKSKVMNHGLDVNLKLYDGKILPCKNGSFDKVISSFVFHHLNREQKINALNEIFRILKNNGELYILDFGKCKGKVMQLTSFLPRLLDGFENTSDNYKGRIPQLLKNAGFTHVKKITDFNTIFGRVAIYYAKKDI